MPESVFGQEVAKEVTEGVKKSRIAYGAGYCHLPGSNWFPGGLCTCSYTYPHS